jgi:hypothetical protein
MKLVVGLPAGWNGTRRLAVGDVHLERYIQECDSTQGSSKLTVSLGLLSSSK